jgi:hypothetical protein
VLTARLRWSEREEEGEGSARGGRRRAEMVKEGRTEEKIKPGRGGQEGETV